MESSKERAVAELNRRKVSDVPIQIGDGFRGCDAAGADDELVGDVPG